MPPRGGGVVGKARSDWRKREAQLQTSLSKTQQHLRSVAAALMDAEKFQVDGLDACVTRMRGFGARQDDLEKEIAANATVVASLTAEELEEASAKPPTLVDGEPQDALLDLLQERLVQGRKQVTKRARLSKEVLKALPTGAGAAGADDDEDDVSMATGQVNLVCPISRVEMRDPVKFRSCGHTFSRAAIEAHFKQLRMASGACPMAGCQAQVHIDDLVPNEEVLFAISRREKLRAAARQNATQNESDDESDDEVETALIL